VVLLLRRRGLLLAVGVDQGKLQLLAAALELRLKLTEVVLPSLQAGGVAECGAARLKPT